MQTDRFQKNVSKKVDWNDAIKTVGDTISNVFGQPDVYNTYNTTNTTNTTNEIKDNEGDNTMLYVGIGGAALLVILLIVFMR